jgi:SAM-dependent methyltransferase
MAYSGFSEADYIASMSEAELAAYKKAKAEEEARSFQAKAMDITTPQGVNPERLMQMLDLIDPPKPRGYNVTSESPFVFGGGVGKLGAKVLKQATKKATKKAVKKPIEREAKELAAAKAAEDLFTAEQIAAAGKTARPWKTSATVNAFKGLFKPKDNLKILDFGAGRGQHTIALRKEGYNVVAHDFAKPKGGWVPGVHDPDALKPSHYDVVFGSNVINTQDTPAMLKRTLVQIRDSLKPGGVFVGNLPATPRYLRAAGERSKVLPSPEMKKEAASMAKAIEEVFGKQPMALKRSGPAVVGSEGLAATPVFYIAK